MATLKRTSIRTIVLGLVAQLVAETDIDSSRIVITALTPDETPIFSASQDILLRVMGEESLSGILDGAGRYDDRRERSLEITARTRLHLDETHTDIQRLTHATLGHLALEDAIVDALQKFWVETVEEGGVDYDAEHAPMTVGRLTMPKRLKNDSDWIYSTFSATLEYTRDLDTTTRQ